MRRVVVTGMGVISCLGTELDEVSANLRAGRGGIVFSEERKEQGFRSGLTTKLPPLDFKAELGRKARKFMPEVAMFGALAANRAIASAQLEPEQYQKLKAGLSAARRELIRNEAELEIAELELEELLEEKKPDLAAIDKRIETLGKLRTKQHKIEVHLWLEQRKVLTPDQVKRLRRHREEMAEREERAFAQAMAHPEGERQPRGELRMGARSAPLRPVQPGAFAPHTIIVEPRVKLRDGHPGRAVEQDPPKVEPKSEEHK